MDGKSFPLSVGYAHEINLHMMSMNIFHHDTWPRFHRNGFQC